MTTTSSAALGNESPEDKAARTRLKRQENVRKAREQLRIQRERERDKNPAVEVPSKTPAIEDPFALSTRTEEMWDKIFIAYMTNFAVKSLGDVDRIISMTDATIDRLIERDKL